MKLFYIDRYLGTAIRFRNGFSIGWKWIHGNGRTDKTSAVIMGYHPRSSITWIWSISWIMPKKWGHFSAARNNNSYGSSHLALPIIGTFVFSWQPRMDRK